MIGSPFLSNCPLTYQRTAVNVGIQADLILSRSCADNCNSYEFMVMLALFLLEDSISHYSSLSDHVKHINISEKP